MYDKSLEILLCTDSYWPKIGGRERYAYNIATELTSKGHNVTVLTRFTNTDNNSSLERICNWEDRDVYHDDNTCIYVISPTNIGEHILDQIPRFIHYGRYFLSSTHLHSASTYIASWAFEDIFRNLYKDYDLIHLNNSCIEYPLSYCSLRFCQRNDIPLCITPHVHIGEEGDTSVDISFYKEADLILPITQFENTFYQSHNINSTTTIPHGHNLSGTGDSNYIYEEYNIDRSDDIIFYLGRKLPYKGYHRLIRSAPLVWSNYPSARFILAGPDYESTYKYIDEDIKDIMSDHRIHDLGVVSNSLREDLFDACDIFCLPSKAEAFGLVYLEAWYYSAPVVALDIPTLRELINGAEAGILTQPDPSSIAESLTTLLQDNALRSSLGENGHKVARRRTWNHVVDKIISAYKSIL